MLLRNDFLICLNNKAVERKVKRNGKRRGGLKKGTIVPIILVT
jgi:hypothetical protein